MAESNIFLWPTSRIDPMTLLSFRKYRYEDIEDLFAAKYPHSYPVLFSSGRAAITAILRSLSLKRNDYVWIPPYTSHCVLNAISTIATPSPILDHKKVKAALIYHQWGFPFQTKAKLHIIEDSVDSLCTSKESLFPNDGAFEVFSLPKIFKSLSGGIALCQRESDAKELKNIRNHAPLSKWLQFALRNSIIFRKTLSAYWGDVDSLNGNLPSIALSDIYHKVANWDSIVENRLKRISILKESYLPSALNSQTGRLPSCWPISYSESRERMMLEYGIASGARHIPDSQSDASERTTKVLPIPLHEDFPEDKLREIVGKLSSAPTLGAGFSTVTDKNLKPK